MTISLETLTSDPSGSENGLVVRNIPSGVQTIDGYVGLLTDGYIFVKNLEQRTAKTYYCINQAVPYSTDTMMTLTETTGFVVGSNASSFSVTSGKTLRIQSIYVSDTGGSARVRLRVSSSGSVTTSTLIVTPYLLSSGVLFTLPSGGIELSGNNQFGISMVQFDGPGYHNTDIFIIGYEY